MRIQKLSSLVSNQIAAGEVIERPASVVKELLENALDAHADTICIEIGFGGFNQIKISDNGAGIVADDLPLAIEAYATSKIQVLSDLYQVKTMGFRGEALASIASVSRLSIYSKAVTEENAMLLRVDEQGISITPTARSQGTTVDVHDLFYNVPVRKQFLKSVRTEFLAIEALVKRFALSEPAIALTFKHNDKPVFVLPAATCSHSNQLRIKKLLGQPFLDDALFIDEVRGDIHLQGYICRPNYQRSQRDKQWVYINRRMIKDKLIQHAIAKAYEDLLHPGRYPACLLYLNLPASEVDVNVHPSKHEVRFREPRFIHDLMISVISEVLKEDRGIAETLLESECPVRDELVMPMLLSHGLQGARLPVFVTSDIPSWLVLNSEFVVMCLENRTHFLVHLTRILSYRAEALFALQTLPLVSRPLLVPVNFVINKTSYDLFEGYQSQLAAQGILFDFVSETRIMVRTIPLCFPTLDIGLFMTELSGGLFSQAELVKHMIRCLTFDAYSVTRDEKIELTDYVQTQLSKTTLFKSWCLALSLEMCRDLMPTTVS